MPEDRRPRKKSGTPPTLPPEDDVTTTGGNGGGGGTPQPAPATPSEEALGKCRKATVTSEDFLLSPLSLVGSWFHRLESGRMVWQGIVVAEPQPGMYLLQIDKLDIGAENVQVLAPLLEMLGETEDDGFRFYDTEDEARSAYAQWIATEGSRT